MSPSRRRASARCEALPPRAPRPRPLAVPSRRAPLRDPHITPAHFPRYIAYGGSPPRSARQSPVGAPDSRPTAITPATIARYARAPVAAPRAAPRCAILTSHPRQSHAMPGPTARRGSRLPTPWRLATARRSSRPQKQKNRPMNERNFLAPPRGIEPRLLG